MFGSESAVSTVFRLAARFLINGSLLLVTRVAAYPFEPVVHSGRRPITGEPSRYTRSVPVAMLISVGTLLHLS